MTFTDPNPVFKVSAFLKSNISKNGASYGQNYHSILTIPNMSNGTMFGDLKWLLNESRGLSAIDGFLVIINRQTAPWEIFQTSHAEHSRCSSCRSCRCPSCECTSWPGMTRRHDTRWSHFDSLWRRQFLDVTRFYCIVHTLISPCTVMAVWSGWQFLAKRQNHRRTSRGGLQPPPNIWAVHFWQWKFGRKAREGVFGKTYFLQIKCIWAVICVLPIIND